MKEGLAVFADHLILVIHAMALLVVAFGTVQALSLIHISEPTRPY